MSDLQVQLDAAKISLVTAYEEIRDLKGELQKTKATVTANTIEVMQQKLGDEMVAMAVEIGRAKDVFNTQALTTYTHNEFVKQFEELCPVFMMLLVGTLYYVFGQMNQRSGQQQRNMTMGDYVKHNAVRMDELKAHVMAALCKFMLGSRFKWAFSWAVVIAVNTIAKSTMVFDALCKVLPGSPGSFTAYDARLDSCDLNFPDLVPNLDLIFGWDNTSIGYVLGASRQAVSQGCVVCLRLVIYLYNCFDEHKHNLQSRRMNAPSKKETKDGAGNWEYIPDCPDHIFAVSRGGRARAWARLGTCARASQRRSSPCRGCGGSGSQSSA